MKNRIIGILHKLFGYDHYLFLFSRFKIRFLKFDKRKKAYLFFNRSIIENENILVVGACTGITTIPLALSHPKAQIFAFEPITSNFNALNKLIKKYNRTNIRTYNLGIGNETIKKEFVLPIIDGVKKQGLAHVKDSTIKGFEKGQIELVSMTSLDDFQELNQTNIKAMKLVAENFEFEILYGAKQFIQKNQPTIYCELWNTDKKQMVFDLIEQYGYLIHVFSKEKNQFIPFNQTHYLERYFLFSPNDI